MLKLSCLYSLKKTAAATRGGKGKGRQVVNDKPAKQAILINVPARGKGRGGRTVQKRKVLPETSSASAVNDGASTSTAEDPNPSDAHPTTKRPAQERPEQIGRAHV